MIYNEYVYKTELKKAQEERDYYHAKCIELAEDATLILQVSISVMLIVCIGLLYHFFI